MKSKTPPILTLLFIGIMFFSCASRKDIVYFQDLDDKIDSKLFETKFQPDDLLMIYVTSKDQESAAPFNMPLIAVSQVSNNANGQVQQQFYLVNNEGFVDFPILGMIKVGGKTRSEVIKDLKDRLLEYIQDPIINLRIMNYKISILGEITKPGSYTIPSERISLIDAISLAGDLTIYGKRNSIKVIREIEGKKTTTIIDITKSDFINSEYYYLKQNDVVYIEPNKTKINGSSVGPNTSVIISSISILMSIISTLILVNNR